MVASTANYVLETGPNDVLLGRGSPIVKYEGNRRFRQLVRTRTTEYVSTRNQKAKDRIAREIIEEVRSRGGRFVEQVKCPKELECLGIDHSTQRVWKLASEPVTIEKAKQALRDRYPAPSKALPTHGSLHGSTHGSTKPSTSLNKATSLASTSAAAYSSKEHHPSLAAAAQATTTTAAAAAATTPAHSLLAGAAALSRDSHANLQPVSSRDASLILAEFRQRQQLLNEISDIHLRNRLEVLRLRQGIALSSDSAATAAWRSTHQFAPFSTQELLELQMQEILANQTLGNGTPLCSGGALSASQLAAVSPPLGANPMELAARSNILIRRAALAGTSNMLLPPSPTLSSSTFMLRTAKRDLDDNASSIASTLGTAKQKLGSHVA